MTKFIRENYLYIVGFLIVLIIFSLRFVNLTILPVFADEAIYVRWSQIMKAEETLRFLPLSDGKPPLFMWMVIPFFKLFANPLFSGRVVSVFAGLGSLVGVSFLSYLLFKSKKASLLTGLLYAISPYTFFFDRMAMADSLLSMFGVWTFIFLYLTVRHSRLDLAMIGGFVLGAAWLTKSPAMFFTVMVPTMWIFTKNIKSIWKSVLLTGLSILIAFGVYNLLRLGPNFHMLSSRNADYVYPLSHIIDRPLDPLKVFLTMFYEWVVLMGPGLILLPVGVTLFYGFKKYWKEILVLCVWTLAPLLVQAEFAKVFTARYTLFLLPYLFILAGASVQALEKKSKLYLSIFLIIIIQGLGYNYQLLFKPESAKLHKSERSGYLEEWTAGQGIKEVADYIRNEQNTNPDQKIVVGTEGYFGTLPDGLQMYLNDLRQITVIGVGLNLLSLPDQLTNSIKFGNKTYLVINNDRLKADPSDLGLKLIASYDKAKREDGTRQQLLFFELQQVKPNTKKL